MLYNSESRWKARWKLHHQLPLQLIFTATSRTCQSSSFQRFLSAHAAPVTICFCHRTEWDGPAQPTETWQDECAAFESSFYIESEAFTFTFRQSFWPSISSVHRFRVEASPPKVRKVLLPAFDLTTINFLPKVLFFLGQKNPTASPFGRDGGQLTLTPSHTCLDTRHKPRPLVRERGAPSLMRRPTSTVTR